MGRRPHVRGARRYAESRIHPSFDGSFGREPLNSKRPRRIAWSCGGCRSLGECSGLKYDGDVLGPPETDGDCTPTLEDRFMPRALLRILPLLMSSVLASAASLCAA